MDEIRGAWMRMSVLGARDAVRSVGICLVNRVADLPTMLGVY